VLTVPCPCFLRRSRHPHWQHSGPARAPDGCWRNRRGSRQGFGHLPTARAAAPAQIACKSIGLEAEGPSLHVCGIIGMWSTRAHETCIERAFQRGRPSSADGSAQGRTTNSTTVIWRERRRNRASQSVAWSALRSSQPDLVTECLHGKDRVALGRFLFKDARPGGAGSRSALRRRTPMQDTHCRSSHCSRPLSCRYRFFCCPRRKQNAQAITGPMPFTVRGIW